MASRFSWLTAVVALVAIVVGLGLGYLAFNGEAEIDAANRDLAAATSDLAAADTTIATLDGRLADASEMATHADVGTAGLVASLGALLQSPGVGTPAGEGTSALVESVISGVAIDRADTFTTHAVFVNLVDGRTFHGAATISEYRADGGVEIAPVGDVVQYGDYASVEVSYFVPTDEVVSGTRLDGVGGTGTLMVRTEGGAVSHAWLVQ